MASRQIYDAVADSSNKIWVVPAGKRYRVFYGSVILVSTATAGDRQLAMQVEDDSANVVFRSLAGAVQPVSVTREYHFAPNPVREAAFVNTQIMVPIPPKLILLPGWTLRVWDVDARDAAADDMTVSLLIEDRELNRKDENQG